MALGDAATARGDMPAAAMAYAEATRAARTADHLFLRLVVRLKSADTARMRGQLDQVLGLCRELVDLAESRGLATSARVGAVFTLWGDVLCERNDLDAAERRVRQGLALTAPDHHVVTRAWALLFWARICLARRDWDGMAAALDDLEQVVAQSEMPVWVTSRAAAWQARLALARHAGETGTATAVAILAARGLDAGWVDATPELDYLREEEYLVLARVLMAQGEIDRALTLLARLRDATAAGDRRDHLLECWILTAVARGTATGALSDGAGAPAPPVVAALEAALNLAAPAGYVRRFVDAGPAMARLLYAAVDRDQLSEPAAAYAGRLLAAFPLTPEAADVLTPAGVTGADREAVRADAERANLALVEPLSPRELEVLQVLATGATNREIAQELVIALNTVKKHVSNILGKLDVANRREAVHRARALGLLED
jgi:LuxR family maltose regulon positive regulatory protein